MIPTIQQIIADLLAGQMTSEAAAHFMQAHIDLAVELAADRDMFAAKALPSILDQKDIHDGREFENAAWLSYQVADAMLKARDA